MGKFAYQIQIHKLSWVCLKMLYCIFSIICHQIIENCNTETITTADTWSKLLIWAHMEQTDSPLPKHPPTRTTSRSTLVVWWAIVQLLWWWRGGIASLSLKECRQRSDLSNKGGTYVEEPHMVLPQRERVWLFQSGGQKTAEQQQPRRGRRERVDGEERWGGWFEHPHMHCTHKSKHLGSLLASPLLLPYPHPPASPNPTTQPVPSGFTCHVFRLRQAWSGLRNPPLQVLCPAVGKLVLPLRATLSFLATSAHLIQSRWMARQQGDAIQQHLGSSTHLPWEDVLRRKEKSGLRIPVENMAKSLSEVQSPVSRNSWKEPHFKPLLKKGRFQEKVQCEWRCCSSRLTWTAHSDYAIFSDVFATLPSFEVFFFFSCTNIAGKEDAASANVFKFKLNTLLGGTGFFKQDTGKMACSFSWKIVSVLNAWNLNCMYFNWKERKRWG